MAAQTKGTAGKALVLGLLASLGGTAGLSALGGCQPATKTTPPALGIVAKPKTIRDRGEESDLRVAARDAQGRPGKGEVRFDAERGLFTNNERSITVPLDTGGSAFAVFRCNVFEDEECFGNVKVTATWLSADAEITSTAVLFVQGCGRPDGGNPPIRRACAAATASECDGPTDVFLGQAGVPGARLNAAGGNGFDDDCDGLVDEGCGCPGSGQTRECYLVPATQVDATSGKPVGWCSTNAKGSVDCAVDTAARWTGVCRGAQPPPLHDTCSLGDFNCDGLQANNSVDGCRCAVEVNCPTEPMVRAPFPDPKNLLPIEGTRWIVDVTKRAASANWKWTVVGGDCDNVLPYPSFALFKSKDTSASGARIGEKKFVRYSETAKPARFVEEPTQKLAAIVAPTGAGFDGGTVYPAFGLSGDYLVQGEFDYQGLHYACTQKVQVRAPGVRAELCWDVVGDDDVDLRFARLQGVTCSEYGWDGTCSGQDCYYAAKAPNWGYAASPDSACKGWSSKQTGTCNNPRLDRDNISCSRTNTDPAASSFCGPENINLDNPKDGDRFVVGVNYYKKATATTAAHPHVNLYCNGARVLSAGYNPVTGQNSFPAMLKSGSDSTGDFWTVATIRTSVDDGGTLIDCDVDTLPSRSADPTRDGPPTLLGGGSDFCVDSTDNKSPVPFNYSSHKFVDPGSGQGLDAGLVPAAPGQWCKH